MSKLLMFGTLGVLLVLLAVITKVLSPTPPPPPTPEKTAQPPKAAADMLQEQKSMQAMLDKEKKHKKELAAATKTKGQQPAKPPTPSIDITDDWFRKRPAGTAGIAEMEKQFPPVAPIASKSQASPTGPAPAK